MSFYTDVIQKDSRYLETSRISDLDLLEPVTRAAVQAIVADAAAMGLQLQVFETYRSQARQQVLWQHGATKLRTVGVHGFGLAADFAKIIDGELSWKGSWEFLGELAAKHGLIWGGTWGHPELRHTFIDADHVQRITVEEQNELFSGRWYPTEDYSPLVKGEENG